MINGKKISVVVPCHNEETQIIKTLKEIPEVVDEVYVIDDQSMDKTAELVKQFIVEAKTLNFKVELISHEVNQGVGGAIASGYKRAVEREIDVAVVMAGDGQMCPSDFEDIVMPVVNNEVDYTKGNRLFSGEAWDIIPRVRYLGNAMLSLLTKIASGYWHVADSQSGYTAIGKRALGLINWDKMYKRYGQPNDLLVRLNIYDCKVRDVPIKPIYNVGETSGLKPIRMMPKLAKLVLKLFFYRMLHKYIIRDFHPLVFFYVMAIVLLPLGTLLAVYLTTYRIFIGPVADTSALLSAFLLITGFQFSFFAMWLDMERNKDLR